MKVGVTKKKFVDKYSELLCMTREEIASLKLLDDNTVIIEYKNNYQKAVNITANSGVGIIKDVARAIG